MNIINFFKKKNEEMLVKKQKIGTVKNKLNDLNKVRYYDTTCEVGVAYHELPFNEFKGPVYRKDLKQRVNLIHNHLNIRGKKGIDIGCAVGGVSFELARRGAIMMGVDFNPDEIKIAQELEDIYRTGCIFMCQDALHIIKKESILLNFDFAVWFSQWMWLVKQHGIEEGKRALFKVSTCVENLFFETSVGDAGAGEAMSIHGITSHEKVIDLIVNNTIYNSCVECKVGDGSALNRSIFYCSSRRKIEYSGQTSVVIRTDFDECIKKFDAFPMLYSNEVNTLKRAYGKHFPKLLEIKDNTITMNYCGEPISINNLPLDYEIQCKEIINDLKACDIIHRDINPTNILVKNGVIIIIDFGFAGRLSNKNDLDLPNSRNNLPRELGYITFRSPYRFDDIYSLNKSIEFIINNPNWISLWEPSNHK